MPQGSSAGRPTNGLYLYLIDSGKLNTVKIFKMFVPILILTDSPDIFNFFRLSKERTNLIEITCLRFEPVAT